MDNQLQQLIELQKEQNQLFKRYLWRLRFSLLSLLLLMTVTAIGLGFVIYQTRTPKIMPTAVPAPMRIVIPPMGSGSSAPAGDIEIRPTTPGTT